MNKKLNKIINNKILMLICLFMISLFIICSYVIINNNLKGLFLMNKPTLIIQIVVQSNIFLWTLWIGLLFNNKVSLLTKYLLFIFFGFLSILILTAKTYTLKGNHGFLDNILISFFYELIIIIPVYYIFSYGKIKNKLYLIISGLIVLIILVAPYAIHERGKLLKHCANAIETNEIITCMYQLDSHQIGYKDYFINGPEVAKIFKGNKIFKKEVEKQLNAVSVVKGNEVYWFSNIELYPIPKEFKLYMDKD